MNTEQARFNMIEQQIRPWDVLDQDVLGLLAELHREDFVPQAYRALAFVDTEIPLPGGRCMLAPRLEARLLQEAKVRRTDRALEIGAGAGYMAALLAHRAQSVVALESVPELARMASANLQRAGIGNAHVREADGSAGLPAEAPFDLIVLSGSVHAVPQALLNQLKVGGRLVGVVGDEPMMRAVRIERRGEAEFATTEMFDTGAPRLAGFPEPSRFHL